MRFDEMLAGVFATMLLLAIIGLVAIERDIPEVLTGAFGVSVGYVFKGTVADRINGNRRRS